MLQQVLFKLPTCPLTIKLLIYQITAKSSFYIFSIQVPSLIQSPSCGGILGKNRSHPQLKYHSEQSTIMFGIMYFYLVYIAHMYFGKYCIYLKDCNVYNRKKKYFNHSSILYNEKYNNNVHIC